MTLTNTCSVVTINNERAEPFETKRGFRQGDSLYCNLFNLIMEHIVRAAGTSHNGTVFYKSIMPLAYADDVDIIGQSMREVSAAFAKFDKEARMLGLAVNEEKT